MVARRLDRLEVGQINRNADHIASFCQVPACSIGQDLVAIPKTDLRPGGQEALSYSPPDALSPTGHDGAFALEVDLIHDCFALFHVAFRTALIMAIPGDAVDSLLARMAGLCGPLIPGTGS